jgi:hypothetical protein
VNCSPAIAADLHARNHGPGLLWRVLAVATMPAGAAAGAWLVLRIGPAAALGLAAVLLALVTAGAIVTARRPGTWRASTPSASHRRNACATRGRRPGRQPGAMSASRRPQVRRARRAG